MVPDAGFSLVLIHARVIALKILARASRGVALDKSNVTNTQAAGEQVARNFPAKKCVMCMLVCVPTKRGQVNR